MWDMRADFILSPVLDYYRIDGKLHNCYLYARYFHGKS